MVPSSSSAARGRGAVFAPARRIARALGLAAGVLTLGVFCGAPGAALAGPSEEYQDPREFWRDLAPARFPIDLPDTKAGKAMRWVLDAMNRDDFTQTGERLSPQFQRFISPAEFAEEARTVHREAFASGEVVPIEIARQDRDDSLAVILTSEESGTFLSATLLVDAEGRIAGLQFAVSAAPGGEANAGPAGAGGGGGGGGGAWDDLSDALADLPGSVAYAVFEVRPREAEDPLSPLVLLPIAGKDADRSMDLAGVGKLYVLGALADAALRGSASWQTPVAVRDDLKTLPSGSVQTLPAGTALALHDLAYRVVLLDDNTASDHILHTLGRGNVEAFASTLPDQVPLELPFLSSREMFTLRLAEEQSLLPTYLAADESQRRLMLSPGGEVHGASLPEDALRRWDAPRAVGEIGPRASPAEVCSLLVRLHEFERADVLRDPASPLPRILRAGPVMGLAPGVWLSARGKTGAEPGVLSGVWLLERVDGRWFTLGVVWNHPRESIDADTFNAAVGRALQILTRDLPAAARPDAPMPRDPQEEDQPRRMSPPMNPADVIPGRRRAGAGAGAGAGEWGRECSVRS